MGPRARFSRLFEAFPESGSEKAGLVVMVLGTMTKKKEEGYYGSFPPGKAVPLGIYLFPQQGPGTMANGA